MTTIRELRSDSMCVRLLNGGKIRFLIRRLSGNNENVV